MEHNQADDFGSFDGVDKASVGEDHVPEVLSLRLLISELFQIAHLHLLLLNDSSGSWHAGWSRHWHLRRLDGDLGGATVETREVTLAQVWHCRLLLLIEWTGRLLLSFSAIVRLVLSLVGVLLLLVVSLLVTLP